MRKISKIAFTLILVISVAGCSLIDPYLEKEEYADQSDVDFLIGVHESGILKRETHFTSSDDYDVKSDIKYFYKNSKLIKKIFTDYNWNSPVVIQKDTFIYDKSCLCSAVCYEMKEIPSSPLTLSGISNYAYPNQTTKIKVELKENGEINDSIVFIYSDDLVIEERHCVSSKIRGYKYEYNSNGKLVKAASLDGKYTTINFFDDNGVLNKTVIYNGTDVLSELSYVRKEKGNQLTIERYMKTSGQSEPKLNSVKIFEEGKLVEWVEHRSTSSGSEWWSTRYEYL